MRGIIDVGIVLLALVLIGIIGSVSVLSYIVSQNVLVGASYLFGGIALTLLANMAINRS